ncbi:hypothetical protein [Lacipirellula sp.]|uniref:hypothetical protein n=1 Tax=Lacipirellula sp. TaxID=2691419 RepID=UPI003D10BC9B
MTLEAPNDRRSNTAYRIALCVAIMVAAAAALFYMPRRPLPAVSLADAVVSFNASSKDSPVGQHEPRLTEAEILAAIQAQLPTLPDSVNPLFADVLRTRSIPQGSTISGLDEWGSQEAGYSTVWWINFSLNTGEGSGYALRIRHNNDPIAKPASEPKLQQTSYDWIP